MGGDDNYNNDGATRLQGNDVDYDDNDEAAAAAAATRDLGENYCPFPVIPPDNRVRTIINEIEMSHRPPPAKTSRRTQPEENCAPMKWWDAAAAAAAAARDLREDYCPVPVLPRDARVATMTTTTANTSRGPPTAKTSRRLPPGKTSHQV
jgi:TusA-related sulfurtransferase